MTALAFRAAGTLVSGTGSLSPGAPAGKTNGDLLILPASVRNNAETVATPTGWTELAPLLHGAWNHLWGRIADGTANDTPTFDFSGSSDSVAQMAAFSGGGVSDLTAIVAASIDKNGTNLDVLYDALTVPEDGTLNIAVSSHNKTSANNGFTFAALSPFTKIGENYNTNNAVAFWWGYNIQTSKSNYSSGTHTYTSSADNLQYTSLIVSLRSVAPGAGMPRRRLGRTPIGLSNVRIY